MHLEGSMVNHLNFRVNERQRSCLDSAIITCAYSKTVPNLTRKAVEVVVEGPGKEKVSIILILNTPFQYASSLHNADSIKCLNRTVIDHQ